MKFLNYISDKQSHIICTKKHIIQDIFRDHWDDFLSLNPSLAIRKVVKDEVSKFLMCGSLSLGYSVYNCNVCGNYAYVPFTCKSRFCPSCGINSCINRSNIMPSRCMNYSHRHITFTIPSSLWCFFQEDRTLLNLLFEASSFTILSWFKGISKKEIFIPGIISSLHTFGRDLKWNPHIHMIVTEGAHGRLTSWKSFNYFPFNMLRKRFMTRLLYLLSQKIHSDKFKKLKNILYKENGKGFYVHAPKKRNSNTSSILSYITRYVGRPVMAESRVLDYDGEFISYWYEKHEDNKRVEEKNHIFDFFKKLIIHIPEKGFHMIRYYGIYAMKKSKISTLKRVKEKLAKPLKWLDKLFLHFKCNPLKCTCGNNLKFEYVVPPSKVQHLSNLL